MDMSNKTKRILGLIILVPLLLSCTLSQSLIDRLNWLWDEGASLIIPDLGMETNPNIPIVEMTAIGQFIVADNYEFSANDLTLHWKVDQRNGEVLPDVWGEGKLQFTYPYCSTGATEHYETFTLKGTTDEVGSSFSGTATVNFQDDCNNAKEEYTAAWKALRVYDAIEGEVGDQQFFKLEIQPAGEK